MLKVIMNEYEQGRWSMFLLISSYYYGKQYYFYQYDGTVYSRKSEKYISVSEAYNEFLDTISSIDWE